MKIAIALSGAVAINLVIAGLTAKAAERPLPPSPMIHCICFVTIFDDAAFWHEPQHIAINNIETALLLWVGQTPISPAFRTS